MLTHLEFKKSLQKTACTRLGSTEGKDQLQEEEGGRREEEREHDQECDI